MAKRWMTGRVALGMAALPLSSMLTVCGISSYRTYRANASVQSVALPSRPAAGPDARILVLAPHCDDETLGVGGYLAQAAANRAHVRVVMLTNGDGFPFAASRQYMRLAPAPDTFMQLASLRQGETVQALRVLGQRPRDVTFLGYPDRGLSQMWSHYWQRGDPYQSPFTRQNRSPYKNSYQRRAPYCGESLLGDLMRLIEAEQPTELLMPDPSDDHPDHWATYCFGTAALEALRCRAEAAPKRAPAPMLAGLPPRSAPGAARPWTENVVVRTYLIHRGDWPVPQGLHEEARLVPPASLLHVDTHWDVVPLSARDRARKRAAIQRYRSQTAVMQRFLASFIRADELFGRLPETRLAPQAALQLTAAGLPADWRHGGARMVDAGGDNIIRQLRPSADLVSLDAQCDRETVYLRLGARDPLSARIEYRLHLQPVASRRGAAGPPVTLSSRDRLPADLPGSLTGGGWQVAIPRQRLGDPLRLLVGAETRFGNVVLDRLSWRVLTLPAPTPAALRADAGAPRAATLAR